MANKPVITQEEQEEIKEFVSILLVLSKEEKDKIRVSLLWKR